MTNEETRMQNFICETVKPEKRTFVSKGWGWEDYIVNNELYCGKLLFFKRSRKCSAHLHFLKTETFYIQSGQLLVTYCNLPEGFDKEDRVGDTFGPTQVEKYIACEKSRKILTPGDVFHVPPLLVHSMQGIEDTEMFEFSTTHYESDSYRIIKGN